MVWFCLKMSKSPFLAFCWLRLWASIVLVKSLLSAILLESSVLRCEKTLFLMFFWKFWKGEPSCSVDWVRSLEIWSGSETNFSLSAIYSQNQANFKSSQLSFFCRFTSLFKRSVIWTCQSGAICICNLAQPYSIVVLRVQSASSFIVSVWTLTSAQRLVSPSRVVRLPATVCITSATAVVRAVFGASLSILIFQ